MKLPVYQRLQATAAVDWLGDIPKHWEISRSTSLLAKTWLAYGAEKMIPTDYGTCDQLVKPRGR